MDRVSDFPLWVQWSIIGIPVVTLFTYVLWPRKRNK